MAVLPFYCYEKDCYTVLLFTGHARTSGQRLSEIVLLHLEVLPGYIVSL